MEGLKPHTVGVIARQDVGNADVEPSDISHCVRGLELHAANRDVAWSLSAEIDRDAPVDLLRHVLRVRVGSGFLDFVMVLPEWGRWGDTFRVKAYEAGDFWRAMTPPQLLEERHLRR